MNQKNISSAIDVLTSLFYVHKDQYVGMMTFEYYVEIGLLKDASLVAGVIEEKRCFDLIHILKLLDMPTADYIESILRGY
ncbi:hypothetical protein P4311_07495 [Bacillus thuringiensis]|uniref:hypothetical protein n=1 Tax=unclassified Bacillus cereus group TaxID=2750818 RepID=UPI001298B50F|nr:hypothetical protein [Bacillus thuringiensis]MRB59386.1 hypothetical protein [Bacillus thuringiensis]